MNKEKFNDYDGFVEKFKPKKTTDDCYTPPAIYDAVFEHVKQAYGIPDSAPVIRPFYPGGDYEHHEYPEDCIVVDNPPFSILSKIIDFYQQRNIRFFLFAPALTTINTVKKRNGITFVNANAKIIYENGANISTGFVTNLSPELIFSTCPSLKNKIKTIQESLKKKKIARLEYSSNIFSAKASQAVTDVEFFIRRDETSPMKNSKFFGGSFLISTEKVKQIEQLNLEAKRIKMEADNAKTEHIPLTPEQQDAIRKLDAISK